MPLSVCYVSDEIHILAFLSAEQSINSLDNHLDDIDILPLVETTDVVSLGNLTLVENHIDGTGMIHDTYGMPTIVTNCSNNYGPYQFPEKLIPLFINNIRHRKPLPVYGKGENVRDWLYVVDHARAIDMIFHKGKIAETYNIGGFNEWKNIDIIKVVIKTVDRLLGRKEGEDMDLITYVTDRKGHDMRYAIDSRKLQKELGWEPSLQFEEGIEETVKWYLDNQEWMDNVTSGDYQKYYDNMYSNR